MLNECDNFETETFSKIHCFHILSCVLPLRLSIESNYIWDKNIMNHIFPGSWHRNEMVVKLITFKEYSFSYVDFFYIFGKFPISPSNFLFLKGFLFFGDLSDDILHALVIDRRIDFEKSYSTTIMCSFPMMYKKDYQWYQAGSFCMSDLKQKWFPVELSTIFRERCFVEIRILHSSTLKETSNISEIFCLTTITNMDRILKRFDVRIVSCTLIPSSHFSLAFLSPSPFFELKVMLSLEQEGSRKWDKKLKARTIMYSDNERCE